MLTLRRIKTPADRARRHQGLSVSSTAELAVSPDLEPHCAFILSARALYTENVQWVAPCRGITCSGREQVIRHLLREAGAMHAPEFTVLRRSSAENQAVDEYVVRFTYTGDGIEKAPISSGELVELKRVRIMELEAGRVAKETCIETWSVLPRD